MPFTIQQKSCITSVLVISFSGRQEGLWKVHHFSIGLSMPILPNITQKLNVVTMQFGKVIANDAVS